MIPFKAPMDDIVFALSATRDESIAAEHGFDTGITNEILDHFARFAEDIIAPIDEPGDQEGCRFEDGRVRMPSGFRDAYQAYIEQGWQAISLAAEFDGQGAPATVCGAISEILAGACHSFQMVTGLVPGAARLIEQFGIDAQRQTWMPKLAAGSHLATMCLTEPQAGSDLSEIRTVASQKDDGSWVLNGEKIFISGGDQDLSDEILHLVLARTGTREDGVRGLTLFLCPSHTSETRRNAITVTRIEEKMGLHASPTCQLVFDGAQAQPIGPVGRGLMCMFTMMNHARLDVALQGVAHASRAHHIAKTYAAERKQGRGRNSGQPVSIDQHFDVARMLARQDMLAMTGRLMTYKTFALMETDKHSDLIEFLTPICKSFCTDAGVEAADIGMQVLGGYGYLREYRIEQTLRDARICQIYEGTNGIHALTLARRLTRHNEGACIKAFEALITELLAASSGTFNLATELLEYWRQMTSEIVASEAPEKFAHDYMQISAATYAIAIWVNIISQHQYARHQRSFNVAEAMGRAILASCNARS
ncbi:acyl-CoA dehydrogenase family protein [Thalassospira lucentensis]|uniref:acyl-CoA dehydrogenase family protein n=1 Tax=Thalassospira lucentensis TaxID=168935 RepID=UPI0003B51638|nr:acyl-CoA dehydrogenase family protein [Thalassospira lucentensis]